MNSKQAFFFWQWQSPLSNWHPAEFKDNEGLKFSNTEQYMMYHKAMKFGDTNIARRIMRTKSPKECKALGRQTKNFVP